MKHSLASQDSSDVSACRTFPFEGTARSLLQSLQRRLYRGLPPEVNLQRALGLSRCAVGQGEMCKIIVKMKPGVSVIASWPSVEKCP